MSDARCYAANKELVASEIFDNEAIVMNLNDGMYYTLSGTGAEVWSLIHDARPISTIVQHLVARHGVEEAEAFSNLDAILGELIKERLIVENSANPEPFDSAQIPDFGAYSKATLEHHNDMTDVLAMDPPLPEPVAVTREDD